MQRKKNVAKKPFSAKCTVFPSAPQFRLPRIDIPQNLHLALKSRLVDNDKFPMICRNYIKCIKSLANVQRIEWENYLIVLKICLYLEQFEINLEMEKHKLLNHKIKKTNKCLILNVPSLDVENPSIVPEDNVIFYEAQTKKTFYARVIQVTGKDLMLQPCSFKDREILNFENKKFNIKFRSQHWPLRCCHYALTVLSNRNWIPVLYPELQSECVDLEYDIEWINPNMKKNKQQKQAIMKILNKSAHPVPYIIFGPPGTGKTATLIEAICQIMRHHSHKNILVCTTSNAAADEITKRLIPHVPKRFIHRMYALSRAWDSVDERIRPAANFAGQKAVFLPKQLLLLKKIIITTLVSSIRLTTMHFREDHFSYIFIDEASQATEPEMFIPLSISRTGDWKQMTGFQTQIVIAGDPHQLGPSIRCRMIEHLLGKSMLERLMNECDPYKKRKGKYNPNYITKLVKNYRSHKNLLYISNKQFYDEELESCGGSDTKIALNWSKLPNKNFPMIFQEVSGVEERTITKSVYNISEMLVVLEYVNMLINSKFGSREIKPKDIGIITPFKRQQTEIAKYLAKRYLDDITVGTVETFQGQERTVIILSTVRSKMFEHDGKAHIGFLSNPKRFNVALTRAKALMIIIGNPAILCTNKHWRMLWEYCKVHNGCIPFEQCPLKPSFILQLLDQYRANLDVDNALKVTKLSLIPEKKGGRKRLSKALVGTVRK